MENDKKKQKNNEANTKRTKNLTDGGKVFLVF